jgi:hypothetical protein
MQAACVPWPELQRLLIAPLASELIALALAVLRATDGSADQLDALRLCAERLTWPAERLNPPPLINGHDLVRGGIPPSPVLGRLLHAVRDAQLLGTIRTRDEALTLARSLAGTAGEHG